ncbi:hypothetical protein C8N43_0344 [Litoreibacter ponti]|uniref:Uncharacterized protein n=1 Tax=Litoreibacter ponti TaxID=1510457 RepID=A0A2T6BI26_9RHOB|nr:hypothetical protein C8N43_0344 [Litoreibacter ponti]
MLVCGRFAGGGVEQRKQHPGVVYNSSRAFTWYGNGRKLIADVAPAAGHGRKREIGVRLADPRVACRHPPAPKHLASEARALDHVVDRQCVGGPKIRESRDRRRCAQCIQVGLYPAHHVVEGAPRSAALGHKAPDAVKAALVDRQKPHEVLKGRKIKRGDQPIDTFMVSPSLGLQDLSKIRMRQELSPKRSFRPALC